MTRESLFTAPAGILLADMESAISSHPVVAGLLFSVFLGVVFIFLLRLATRLVAGFTPRFAPVCAAWFLGWLASSVCAMSVGWLVSLVSGARLPFAYAVVAATALLVKPLVYRLLLKSPEGNRIGFGKCLLIAVMELVAVAVVFAAVMLYCLLTMHPRM